MKKYTDYRLDLFTGLLILNAVPACISTRQKLGMDGEQPTAQKSLESLVMDRVPDGEVPPIADPMVLDDVIMSYLKLNGFSAESISALLAKGLHINAQDEAACTLLIYVILDGGFVESKMEGIIFPNKYEEVGKIVTFVIDRSADVNKADKFGFTPLMAAAYKGYGRVIKILLEHGAEPSTELKNGSEISSIEDVYNALFLPGLGIRLKAGMKARDFVFVHNDYDNPIEDDGANIIEKLDAAAAKLPGAKEGA